jgi:hypothetical protein
VAGDKIEGWDDGEATAMCQTVSCGATAKFGMKDGRGCQDEGAMTKYFNGIAATCTSESLCGGGNKGDCRWSIPVPRCEEGAEDTLPDGSNPSQPGDNEDPYYMDDPETYITCLVEYDPDSRIFTSNTAFTCDYNFVILID